MLECISSQNEIDNNGIASMKLTTPAYLVTKNPQWSDDLKGWTYDSVSNFKFIV